MATISEMQEEIGKFIEERDWSKFHNGKDLAISLSLESAELLELFQWSASSDLDEEGKVKLGHELADVLYWTLLLADKYQVDLCEAFYKKMQINVDKYPISKSKGRSDKYNTL